MVLARCRYCAVKLTFVLQQPVPFTKAFFYSAMDKRTKSAPVQNVTMIYALLVCMKQYGPVGCIVWSPFIAIQLLVNIVLLYICLVN